MIQHECAFLKGTDDRATVRSTVSRATVPHLCNRHCVSAEPDSQHSTVADARCTYGNGYHVVVFHLIQFDVIMVDFIG